MMDMVVYMVMDMVGDMMVDMIGDMMEDMMGDINGGIIFYDIIIFQMHFIFLFSHLLIVSILFNLPTVSSVSVETDIRTEQQTVARNPLAVNREPVLRVTLMVPVLVKGPGMEGPQ